MATDKAVLEDVMASLSDLEGVFYRPMMGEYLLYYRGRVVGGVYDDRLLVKATASARAALPEAEEELPYPGGKPMLRVPDAADPALRQRAICSVFDEQKA